jgi:hypothetical protein
VTSATSETFITCDELLHALRNVDDLPTVRVRSERKNSFTGQVRYFQRPNHRTIYEAGKGSALAPSGHFYVDYASFTAGCDKEVPRELIDRLEREGVIVKAYPDQPNIKAWRLAEKKAL